MCVFVISLHLRRDLSSEAGISLFILPIYLVVVLIIQVRCVTPQSSPTRGHWPHELFLMYSQIFTINIYK